VQNQDWLVWQKQVIREEYVEGKRDEKSVDQSEIRKGFRRKKFASR
jgi:hypothetical protein